MTYETQRYAGLDDRRREDWERVKRSVGTGYLVRWDQHDPEAVEQEVGPVTREQTEEQELVQGWFG